MFFLYHFFYDSELIFIPGSYNKKNIFKIFSLSWNQIAHLSKPKPPSSPSKSKAITAIYIKSAISIINYHNYVKTKSHCNLCQKQKPSLSPSKSDTISIIIFHSLCQTQMLPPSQWNLVAATISNWESYVFRYFLF